MRRYAHSLALTASTTRALYADGVKRLRATLRWAFTAAAVLIIPCWLLSLFWTAAFGFPPIGLVGLYRGTLAVEIPPTWAWPGVPVVWQRESDEAIWWFLWEVDSSGFRDFGVPFWMFEVTLLAVAVPLWRAHIRSRRNANPNICRKCGYSRAGLPPGTSCPECGATPSTPSP
ncbi:hypothetical protein PHYC_02185 [Phycisphaerales bacterium]|nr:hypothetical protein PHYC_02185 [Phycisphaerales bacterium]